MERVTYRLRADGKDLVVEVWREGRRNHARLLVDGAEAAAGNAGGLGSVDLRAEGGLHVRVAWWWTGRIARVALVERGAALTPFAPPPGTRAARFHEFQQRHPLLFAARHLVGNAGGALLAALGVGALLSALLPDVRLPEIDLPDWLRYLNPLFYLRPVFEWIGGVVGPVFRWIGSLLPDFGPWLHYGLSFLVACLLAVAEYQRRKKRAREQAESAGDPPAPGAAQPDQGEPPGADGSIAGEDPDPAGPDR